MPGQGESGHVRIDDAADRSRHGQRHLHDDLVVPAGGNFPAEHHDARHGVTRF